MLEELASAGRFYGRGRRAPTHPRAFLQPNPKNCAQLQRRITPNPEERTTRCSWRTWWHEGPNSSLAISRG